MGLGRRQLDRHRLDPLALLRHLQPLEDLRCQPQVVDAAIGAVVEDRDRSLGRFGVGDRAADHRLEGGGEMLLEGLQRLARVPGAQSAS